MADLPSIAQRINDIQVAANAPITESTQRTLGSDINFLLDFLGITNGETSTSGIISEFISALDTIRNHTMNLEFTHPGSGAHNIGTYTQIPYLDHVFWVESNSVTGNEPITSSGFSPHVSYDSGTTFKHINASLVTPSNTTIGGTDSPKVAGTKTDYPVASTDNATTQAYRQFSSIFFGNTGYEHRMRSSQWQEFGVVSWRDMPVTTGGTVVKYFSNQSANSYKFYLSYRFNLESAFLVAP